MKKEESNKLHLAERTNVVPGPKKKAVPGSTKTPKKKRPAPCEHEKGRRLEQGGGATSKRGQFVSISSRKKGKMNSEL